MRVETARRVLGTVISTAAIFLLPTTASAQTPRCSIGMLEGAWLFATGVGQLGTQPPLAERVRGKQLTAVGTMNIDARGNVSGRFDQNTVDVRAVRATYTGRITLEADCTGTLALITSGGATRTDSLVVLLRQDPLLSEIWGMSQVSEVALTYVAKRIADSSR